MMPAPGPAVAAVDAGDLPLGGGLLSLVRPALGALPEGSLLAVLSSARGAGDDLGAFCRAERHEYLGSEAGEGGLSRHLIVRGRFGVPRGPREDGLRLEAHDGRVLAADLLTAVPMPEHASVTTGFAPRGAQVEPGGPPYPFTLRERDRVASPDIAQLYDQACSAQWDGSRDLPWDKLGRHSAPVERATAQLMTFLAENELSALYLPSRFVAKIHPAFVEVAMFLATQMADEARHTDVFLKRARMGGAGAGVSSVTTARSLLSLLEQSDFTEASFLLSVLGEGTFLDLLRFIERHAPDELTAEIARRTRADEARHVHFGMSHVRHVLEHDPSLYGRLEAAVRRRAAVLQDAGGVPAAIQDALVVLAAGGTEPKAIRRGHRAFRELLETMHERRIRRLVHTGFSPEQAEALSSLHTANFM